MKALVAIALLLPLSAVAGTRSHTSSVTENVSAQSWTHTCSLRKKGVSPLKSYSGSLFMRYNDPSGEEEFMRRNWSVGPGATTFTETSTGLYSITASLTTTSTATTIVVKFSATRYGPLYPKYNGDTGALIGYGGTFTCVGAIFAGNDRTGALLHNIYLQEGVGAWQ
jgi:hypothetical protein